MDLQKHHKATFDNIAPEKRERIINAATAEFALKGFENANINSIAKKADVSVGSLYKYFENKQDMFLTIIHYSIATMEDMLNELLESDEDILLKVEHIIRTIQQYSKENVLIVKLYNVMTSENNPRFASQFAFEMESMTARIYRTAIERGKKAGDVREDIDSAFAAYLLDNIFMNLQFSYACDYYRERLKIYTGNDTPEKDDFVVEQCLKFIKSALKK
ncbi:MAG: TetR/AcrR family transcriptional regulator [Clostridiaceae bacterium]|nr:TetR/AcrR family transcriptional regulator [Clostridiaceae bacterium]